MSHKRNIRRLAMQVLYQLDLRGEDDLELIRSGLSGGYDPDGVCTDAMTLAEAAWGQHAQADAVTTRLAPEWPTHRQPPVDRAILRLAYYEMDCSRTPTKVAINEAVELAKHFAAEQSPSFINGLLDKIAKEMRNKADHSPRITGNGDHGKA